MTTKDIPESTQATILERMKKLDLETYKEMYASVPPEHFAELFYRIGDALTALSGQTMPTHVANSQTELYWMYKTIADNYITSERRALVQQKIAEAEAEVERSVQEATVQ
jgi:predicted metal-dependent phosphoesterase TrpH